jgi:uncharacterized protein (UPF0147 family)
VSPEELDDLLPEDLDEETVAVEELAKTLAPLPQRRDDPSTPPYPRGLVLDILLKTRPLPDLLIAYKISVEDFKSLTQHPVFRQDMQDMKEKLREEGFSFRVKAQAQAEQYLQAAWTMVHDASTPANVRADLIKWTTKVAALEPTPQSIAGEMNKSLPQMAAALKDMPADELEMRVYQIIARKAKTAPPEGVTYDA